METETTEEPRKTPRDRVKFVASLVVGGSVSSVIKTLIRQNMTPKSNFQSVELYIAAFTLGGLVAKQATTATDETIDKYADAFLRAKAKHDAVVTPETPAE